MFCPECGRKNPDDAVFCENCGTKIMDKDQQVILDQSKLAVGHQIKAHSRKAVSKKSIVVGIIILFFLVSAITFVLVGKSLSSPERSAEQYFECVMDGDWENVYSQLELSDSELLSKKMFLAAKEDSELEKVSSYTVGSVRNAGKEDTKKVTIRYRSKGDSGRQKYEITLVRQEEKFLFFFNKWKVIPSDMLINNYTLTVPLGTTVSLDGVTLADKEKVKEGNDLYSEYFDTYQVDALFEGNHDIKVTADNMEDYEETVNLEKDEYDSFYLTEMELKQDVVDQVATDAKDILKSILQAGVEKKDFSSIQDYFSTDNEIQSDMKSSYESFIDDLEYAEVSNLEVQDISATTESSYADGAAMVDVTLDFEYNYTYNDKDWWTGELTVTNDTKSNDATVYFKYEDGKWVITYLSFYSLY